MQEINYLKLFDEMRLCPWEPSHDPIIRANIAAMEVTNPERAESYKQQYKEKMDKYLGEVVKESVVVTVSLEDEVVIDSPVEEVETVEVKPKKKGRPKKSFPKK